MWAKDCGECEGEREESKAGAQKLAQEDWLETLGLFEPQGASLPEAAPPPKALQDREAGELTALTLVQAPFPSRKALLSPRPLSPPFS